LEEFVLKRGLDLALSCFFLILALPLLIMAAIAIKFDSRGPVFFTQARMGRRFQRFQILKLRTMRVSEPGLAFTLNDDSRVTRVGSLLRWLKIDELPQLWNVLCGEMSLVGPRPVIPELAIEYRNEYKTLLEVRPGLTDPATVKYCHEEEFLSSVPDPLRYFKNELIPDKLRLSRTYMKQSNSWTDLLVLLRTFFALAQSLSRMSLRLMPVRQRTQPVPETKLEPASGMKKPPLSEGIGMRASAGLKRA
jgi:lipopolysaccharide/colanic/teichoic acid biosynthesis glycosyltransferase